MEEGLVIAHYKDYARRHFGDGSNMERYRAVHFDPDAYQGSLDRLGKLELYLKDLGKLAKHLSKAAELRQRHYEDFLAQVEEEDDGHCRYREAMNKLAADAKGKLMIWQRVKEDELDRCIKWWNSRPVPPDVIEAAKVTVPEDERGPLDVKTKFKTKPMPLSRAQRRQRDKEAEAAMIKDYCQSIKDVNRNLFEFYHAFPAIELSHPEDSIEPVSYWGSARELFACDDLFQGMRSFRKKYRCHRLRCSDSMESYKQFMFVVYYMIIDADKVDGDMNCISYKQFVLATLTTIREEFHPYASYSKLFKLVLKSIDPTHPFTRKNQSILNLIGSHMCGVDAPAIMSKLNLSNVKTCIKHFYQDRCTELTLSMDTICFFLEKSPGAKITKEMIMATNAQRLLDYKYHQERHAINKYHMKLPYQSQLDVVARLQNQIKSNCM